MRIGNKTVEVIVGNIGTVYSGGDERKAIMVYREYKRMSKEGYGRASAEPVTLMRNNEIVREYFPPDKDASHCGNCNWAGVPDTKLEAIPDLASRLDVGGVVPSGECPECGALCYLDKATTTTTTTKEV